MPPDTITKLKPAKSPHVESMIDRRTGVSGLKRGTEVVKQVRNGERGHGEC
jgi:hypothetical protein